MNVLSVPTFDGPSGLDGSLTGLVVGLSVCIVAGVGPGNTFVPDGDLTGELTEEPTDVKIIQSPSTFTFPPKVPAPSGQHFHRVVAAIDTLNRRFTLDATLDGVAVGTQCAVMPLPPSFEPWLAVGPKSS